MEARASPSRRGENWCRKARKRPRFRRRSAWAGDSSATGASRKGACSRGSRSPAPSRRMSSRRVRSVLERPFSRINCRASIRRWGGVPRADMSKAYNGPDSGCGQAEGYCRAQGYLQEVIPSAYPIRRQPVASKLGEMLVKAQLITDAQLEEVMKIQPRQGVNLARTVVRHGY